MEEQAEKLPEQDATLAAVPQHDCRLPPYTPASVLYAEFQREPMLPGAIVAAGDEVVGLISRQHFFQLLSHRFGASLFLDAPVQKVLGTGPREYLTLAEEMSIHEAARCCLARPRDLVFEPVLVADNRGKTRLLGMHELLLAQSHQLTLAHDTIQKQIAVVEAANRAKGDFLANMSHEIRTPLNAIVGMTELLLESDLAPRQHEYAGTVIDSCENLMTIINDVLDFSKIESGRLELEHVAFDIREHLGDTLKGLAVKACSRGIELVHRCEEDVPYEILGDPVRLRQVMINLVGNAIKFTHEGEVAVYVDLQSSEADEVVLHYCVSDTGIGIPAEKIGLIFDAFEQADTSTTREYGGTGLGLAISLRLVRKMRGDIWVESEVGCGSKFHFTAKFGVAPARKSGSDESQLATGARVLLVEGNSTNRSILLGLLKTWNLESLAVGCAAEAQSALAAAEAAGVPFDLAIVGSKLPDRCGFELVDMLQGDATLTWLPILMMIPADRATVAHADRAGVAGCLTKPVKESELLNAILAALGIRPVEQPAARLTESNEPDLPPLKILVGEDSLVNQKLIHEMLTRRGHTVHLAGNGEEVLARLAGERFDILLLDVQMPLMDGFEATRRIRLLESDRARKVPIIALTAHALPDDRRRCLEAGMDEYVAKPIRTRALLHTIAVALRKRHVYMSGAEALDEQSEAASLPYCSELERQYGDGQKPSICIDWQHALESLDGSEHVLRVVIEATMEESPRMAAAIRAAIEAKDATQVRLAAHTLKGALRYFGDTPASAAACRLERMGSDGRFEDAGEICRQLDTALAEALGSMYDYLQQITARADSCGCTASSQV
jgi:signal transduction histidine kinase/DNA-binding response OmpR family regulator/HPt (histidine-containing phosphotransfer) domain-containing protein